MPSDQVPRIESSMGIGRTVKELRERANRPIVLTRHNPALGIMPEIMDAGTMSGVCNTGSPQVLPEPTVDRTLVACPALRTGEEHNGTGMEGMHLPDEITASPCQALRHGDEPILAVFRLSDEQCPLLDIDIPKLQKEGFPQTQAAPVHHTEEQGIHQMAVGEGV